MDSTTEIDTEDTLPSDLRDGRRRSLTWRIIQAMLYLPFRLFVRTRVIGTGNIVADGGGILLANHQSFLDPIFVGIGLTRPVSFLARDSLWKVPFIGWVCRNLCAIPISRTAFRGGSIRTALERLDHGYLVGIYPEGTRSSGPPHDFRPGFLSLVRRSNAPIYPVAIVGADRALPKGAWFIRPAQVTVVFGEALTHEEADQLRSGSDDRAIAMFMRDKVAALYESAATGTAVSL